MSHAQSSASTPGRTTGPVRNLTTAVTQVIRKLRSSPIRRLKKQDWTRRLATLRRDAFLSLISLDLAASQDIDQSTAIEAYFLATNYLTRTGSDQAGAPQRWSDETRTIFASNTRASLIALMAHPEPSVVSIEHAVAALQDAVEYAFTSLLAPYSVSVMPPSGRNVMDAQSAMKVLVVVRDLTTEGRSTLNEEQRSRRQDLESRANTLQETVCRSLGIKQIDIFDGHRRRFVQDVLAAQLHAT